MKPSEVITCMTFADQITLKALADPSARHQWTWGTHRRGCVAVALSTNCYSRLGLRPRADAITPILPASAL